MTLWKPRSFYKRGNKLSKGSAILSDCSLMDRQYLLVVLQQHALVWGIQYLGAEFYKDGICLFNVKLFLHSSHIMVSIPAKP
jgi:hypothetical protein